MLIAVSVISTLMVFWLGSRHISDAHVQFYGANQLRKSVTPEATLFSLARNELSLSLKDGINQLQYQYSEEDITNSLDEIEQILNQLRFSRIVIKGQTDLPNMSRSEDVRMQLYDAYANAIESVNNLRKQIHAYPQESNIGVIAGYKVKNSVWNLSDAIHQTSTLIESFMHKSHNSGFEFINMEYLNLRVFQQHESAKAELVHNYVKH